MLRSLNELCGYSIRATDGVIGEVVDFYFDDAHWVVRYLVADTGKWLPGRQVLIAPEALQGPDWEKRVFPVSLTREQVEKSPGVDADRPVSRQREIELAQYYRWSPYWMANQPSIPAYGMRGVHLDPQAAQEPQRARAATAERMDPHLRSMREVLSYRILAVDGEIGQVEDFIAHEGDWRVHYLVVNTRKWLPGRKVLVAPRWVREVLWSDSQVTVDLTRENIRRSPAFDPSEPINEEYERALYDYYGRPRG